jgi:hypothetical protein
MRSDRLSRLAPWSGLLAGALAWSVQHQVLSDLLHFSCSYVRPATGLAIGAAAALIATAGGWVSWREAHRCAYQQDLGARRFIAHVGVLAAVFFLLAVMLQTAAAWIVPACQP